MKKLPKVKVSDLSEADLAKIKARNIQRAKEYYEARPSATPDYLAMQLRMPIKFILDNRKEIGV